MDFQETADLYKKELFGNILPFWERYSLDAEYGGYFTCLDRDGTVYDTDKFIWLQSRQVWLFSMLYNCCDQNSAWLNMAKHGADFLLKHGSDEQGNWYFSLDRSGQPLVQPYNIFSDFFTAMAFCQYGLATEDSQYTDLAVSIYHNILRRKGNPKGQYNKQVVGARSLHSIEFPMIMANLALEMGTLLPPDELERILDVCVEEVMGLHLDKKRGLMYENVLPDGGRPDGSPGRLLNPGHGIEAMWFIMNIGLRRNNSALIQQTVDVILSTVEYAWDETYDGIYYFMDVDNRPLQKLEWDLKLWWVHLETLVALSKAYRATRREECLQWYQRVHDYSWSHFSDPEYGEWFGYLNRQGEKILSLKGGKWKGCFHVPRALWLCYCEFTELSQISSK